MSKDKFTAVWVSHSSISDFLKCPKSYYLKNVYKDPNTFKKIQITNPALSLGQAVHAVLESLSSLPKDERFNNPLSKIFEVEWQKISGERGGFTSEEQERKYKNRGLDMLNNVYHNPGPLTNLALKIKQDLPFFWLSEEDNIILCGKIDWLEYMPDSDSVHIIDFKTGKSVEDPNSLQLPIYHLLVDQCQNKKVSKASYWYLDAHKHCQEKELPDLDEARKKIMEVARKIKLARQLKKFDCPSGEGGCMYCKPMEKILDGQGKLVAKDQQGRDVYILSDDSELDKNDVDIL